MSVNAISRRNLIKTGTTCTLIAASGLLQAAAKSSASANMPSEQLIHQWYSTWETKDASLMDSMLADNFTFTSPNDDDHISKSAFKERCWPQSKFIERFELEDVFVKGNEALVKYLCHTTKGTSFRNVEYLRFADGKLSAIECYFGGHLGYPTATISGKQSSTFCLSILPNLERPQMTVHLC
jgi:ketosteroid isomerase-like protein